MTQRNRWVDGLLLEQLDSIRICATTITTFTTATTTACIVIMPLTSVSEARIVSASETPLKLRRKRDPSLSPTYQPLPLIPA